MCIFNSSDTPAPYVPPPAPAPAKQVAKAPAASAVRADAEGTGQAGGAPGVAQTMLTGPGGVSLDKLLLGKNSLLGA